MYVVNETTEHYAVVHSPTYLVWKEETTPVMIYTTAGLMLYNYAGWLDSDRNNQEFTKNERLITSVENPTSDFNFGPLLPSVVDPGRRAMFVTRNIIIETPDNTTASPAIVGMELEENSLKIIFDIFRDNPKKWSGTESFLVDDKGFIVYENPWKSPENSVVGTHMSISYPELTAEFLKSYFNTKTKNFEKAFTVDTFKNCLKTCRFKTKSSNSARISSILATLYSLFTLSSTHSQLGSNKLRPRDEPTHRCCSDYQVFKLNREAEAREFRIPCNRGCTRVFLAAPINQTNLLLVQDLSPDCVCSGGNGDMLKPINTTDVYNVSFGAESYAPLECTNNVNISTLCSGAMRCGYQGSVAITMVIVLLIGYTFT
eukprot:sb/3465807/